MKVLYLFCISIIFILPLGNAQKISLFDIPERLIAETQWEYEALVEKNTQTAIHRADENSSIFIYFRYDGTAQQVFNEKLEYNLWSLEGNTLSYKLRDQESFKVKSIKNNRLVLEFKAGKSTFQYWFKKINDTSRNVGFVKPSNELPTVYVKRKSIFDRKWKNRLNKHRNKKRKSQKKQEIPTDYIAIEMIGGGYYGGINPVYRDMVQVDAKGNVRAEIVTEKEGSIIRNSKTTVENLKKIVDFATQNNFFEEPLVYDCESLLCEKRKSMKPAPVPLRLSITYNQRKRVVSLNLYGKDRHQIQYVQYPKYIDEIIDFVRDLSNQEI